MLVEEEARTRRSRTTSVPRARASRGVCTLVFQTRKTGPKHSQRSPFEIVLGRVMCGETRFPIPRDLRNRSPSLERRKGKASLGFKAHTAYKFKLQPRPPSSSFPSSANPAPPVHRRRRPSCAPMVDPRPLRDTLYRTSRHFGHTRRGFQRNQRGTTLRDTCHSIKASARASAIGSATRERTQAHIDLHLRSWDLGRCTKDAVDSSQISSRRNS